MVVKCTRRAVGPLAAAAALGCALGGQAALAARTTNGLAIVRLKPSTAAHGLARDRVNVIPATRRLSFRVALRNHGTANVTARVTLRIGTRSYNQTKIRTIRVSARTTRSTAFRHLQQVAFAQRQTIVVRVTDASGRTRSASYPVVFTLR